MLRTALVALSVMLWAMLWRLHRSWLLASDQRVGLPPELDDGRARAREDARHRNVLVMSYVAAIPGAVALYPTVSSYIQHVLDPTALALWPAVLVAAWSVAKPLTKATARPKAGMRSFALLSAAIGFLALSVLVSADLIALGILDRKVLEDLIKGM